MLLLPAALSYFKSNLDNYSKQDLKLLGDNTSLLRYNSFDWFLRLEELTQNHF